MRSNELGKVYKDGEYIVRQGDSGNAMYVIQAGKAEVIVENQTGGVSLSILERGDVFGEMALFTRSRRSASVRAVGEARVLTIDKKGFLRRIHEDPSLAFSILKKMSDRIQTLNSDVLCLKSRSGKETS